MKRNNDLHNGKAINKKDVQKKGTFPQNLGSVIIRYPLLWLALAAFIVYLPTLGFGFTELDDTIFVREFAAYNEQLSNLAVSFHRGLFDAVRDPYFRPVFLDSMILNYHLPGDGLVKYHLVNILLHVASVVLLYKLFIRLNIRKLHSFILALTFAVHPVLSQAVAWIPGRNDTLLAVFSLAFFITAIDHYNFGKIRDLLLSALFLLLAFFTKETAVFVPVVLFVMLIIVNGNKLLTRNSYLLVGCSVACFLIWYGVRSRSPNILAGSSPQAGTMLNDLVHRLPLIIQYTGKIFLPLNQSVFPMQEDTSVIYGLIALAILAAALYLSRYVNWRVVTGGAIIFILFLIPALLVPNNLNEQTFEHRLYLPMIGMLIVISETALFRRLVDSGTFFASLGMCAVMAAGNFSYQRNFADPITFWTQAVETSPHSGYAKMMLGAREDNVENSYKLFREAYKLDPQQKYINYYYARMLQMKDSVLESEPYLLREKKISDFFECDFYLARVAMTKGDTTGSMLYLESYTERNPSSEPAHNNLLLMYFNMHKYTEAKAHIEKMHRQGVPVPPHFEQMLQAATAAPQPQPAQGATTKAF